MKDPLIVGQMTRLATEIAESEGIAESGFRVVVNTDADAGQTVFHLHMHLLGGRQHGVAAGMMRTARASPRFALVFRHDQTSRRSARQCPRCRQRFRAISTRRERRRTRTRCCCSARFSPTSRTGASRQQRELTDDEVNEVLRKGIKKRRESIEMYDKAARADLADRERAEVTALEAYLPGQRQRRRDSRGDSEGDRGGRDEHWRRDGKGESDVQGTRGRRDDQPDRERGVEQPPLSSSPQYMAFA